MASSLSRRKLAQYAADQLQAGNKDTLLTQLAAYLIETKSERRLGLLVRDIEAALAEKGTVVAEVTSATPLTSDIKAAIAKLLKTEDLHIRETIDASVLGGVRIEASGRLYDGTMRRKLNKLTTMSAKEGIQ